MGRTGSKIQGRSSEYINDFLYFVIKPDESRGRSVFIYCSGVNGTRFLPLTKGRHGIGSNPATRGLQLISLGVRNLALSRGAKALSFRGRECAGIAPTPENWFTDRLVIENAPDSLPEEAISYCVINFLKKFIRASMLENVSLPEKLPEPDELQLFLETLCKEHGR